MRFEVLGPLRVLDQDGGEVTPPGRLQRLLLASLLLRVNQPVRDDDLVERLWPGDVDHRTQARLQVQAHRLRAVLDDPDRLTREVTGYRLAVGAGEYDVAEFDALAAHLLVIDDEPQTVARRAREALDLWRGEPFEDVEDVVLQPELRRWTDQRLSVLDALAEAELASGNPGSVLPELEYAVHANPLNERLLLLLMRTLHAAGRSADALEAFGAAQSRFRDELGIDPGAALRELQAVILAGEDPATASVPTPAQLPALSSDLCGRGQDLVTLDNQWSAADRSGVHVVTGTAGVGKTAFAVHWAQQHREDYPDGQLFYDLRGFSADHPAAPGDVLAVFLRSLGFDTEGMSDDTAERTALFRSLVDGRRLLVVLDNARSADQVRPLLPAAPGCCVVVTSREALTGLAVREGARPLELAPLEHDDCLDLLARLTDDRMQHEPGPAAELVRLCARLPLALRIAAEQVRARPGGSVAELVAELSGEHDRLDLMDAGDGPSTDVRAVFSWSYESLPKGAARLFRHFGMLPGKDADLDALSALCGHDASDVRRNLAVLLRAHLVTEAPAGRFWQHDLLRAYAGEGARLLEPEQARREAHARLVGHYSQRAFLADEMLRPGETFSRAQVRDSAPDVPPFSSTAQAREWLERHVANVLAAIDGLEEDQEHRVVELARSFNDFLTGRGRAEEANRLLTRTLEIAVRTADAGTEAWAESSLAVLLARGGQPERARERFLRTMAIHEQVTGDPVGVAAAHGNLGVLAYVQGDTAEAVRHVECSVAGFEETGERRRRIIQATNLAVMLKDMGEAERSARLITESMAMAREDGLWLELAIGLGTLADLRLVDGDLKAATEFATEACALATEHGFHEVEADTRAILGKIALAQGRFREAQEVFRAALRAARRSGHVLTVGDCLRGYARSVSEEDPMGGLAYCREALDYAATHGLTRTEISVRLDLARHLDRHGDRDAALAEVDRADALCGDEAGLAPEVARVRSEIQA